jgi:hypothetical protein
MLLSFEKVSGGVIPVTPTELEAQHTQGNLVQHGSHLQKRERWC